VSFHSSRDDAAVIEYLDRYGAQVRFAAKSGEVLPDTSEAK
jgi:hypothetical protein